MKAFTLIVFSFLVGQLIMYYSGSFKLSDKTLASRNPSAIRQYYDFTHLRGSALEVAMRERMIGNIEVAKIDDEIGISLGHFAFKNQKGESVLGCQQFGKVTFVLEAEGSAVNGEKSTMEVKGECHYTDDLAKIKPVIIPFEKLMKDRPMDGDLNFNFQSPVSIKLLNLTDSWPEKWVLIGVRLESVDSEFIVDRNEILKIIGQPLFLRR